MQKSYSGSIINKIVSPTWEDFYHFDQFCLPPSLILSTVLRLCTDLEVPRRELPRKGHVWHKTAGTNL